MWRGMRRHMSHVSTHMNQSRHKHKWVMSHIWISHATHIYEWVLSPHIWISHVTNINESCHIYEWVMPHTWMGHVTHMNASCAQKCQGISSRKKHINEACLHTYQWVMSHMWMNHVFTHEWITSRASLGHVTYMNESCHTFEWVMSQTWMSCHTYGCVALHIWMSHATHINGSRYMYECVTPHIWMSHFTYVNSHATPMNGSCHTYKWVKPHIWMGHVTHMNASCVQEYQRTSANTTTTAGHITTRAKSMYGKNSQKSARYQMCNA